MPVGRPLDETSLVLDTDVLTDWRYGQRHTQQAIAEYIDRLNYSDHQEEINDYIQRNNPLASCFALRLKTKG